MTTGSQPLSSLKVVLAAGGTGGHVFPAEALAQELLERGAQLTLVTDNRGAAYGGALGQIETKRIRASAVAGQGLLKRVRAVFDLGLGVLQAMLLLRRLRPDAVVGFGGYASVPTMVAALRLGLPTIVHEQNAVPGRANRMIAAKVTRFATAFEPRRVAIRANKVHTGMPVRPAVAAHAEAPYMAPLADSGPLRLLITGGSQGAQVFSSLVPEAIALLPETLRSRLEITQQCRPEDLEAARKRYEDLGMGGQIELSNFFGDLPERLAQAHLVICRSGASTISELAVTGRPSVLVPYPFAADDHQTANARALSEAGAAWLMPQDHLSPDSLANRLTELFQSPDFLSRASACCRVVGVPDAAVRLADLVTDLVGGPANSASGDLPMPDEQSPQSRPTAAPKIKTTLQEMSL
ncbi:MAG: undecaprenyldiphospho-muramoylpentapeptide beta-N-acetylglucosaminyltransferase [Rhodospirillaceae bacterium]